MLIMLDKFIKPWSKAQMFNPVKCEAKMKNPDGSWIKGAFEDINTDPDNEPAEDDYPVVFVNVFDLGDWQIYQVDDEGHRIRTHTTSSNVSKLRVKDRCIRGYYRRLPSFHHYEVERW